MSAGGDAWRRGAGGRRSRANGDRLAVPGAGRRSAIESEKCVPSATATITITSATANHTTPATSTSVVWCARRGVASCFAWLDATTTGGEPGRSAMVPRMARRGFRAFHPRIMDRDERPLIELPEENRRPDSADPDGRGEIEDVNGDPARVKDRLDQPDQVEGAHREDPSRDGREKAKIRLDAARKEQEKRRPEVREQDEERHEFPVRVQPREIPGDLLRKVPGPDDDELRERHVPPEHQEHEQEIPEIAKDAGPRESGERLDACKISHREQHERHCRETLPDHERHPEDRRVPVRRERHQPVDRGEEGRRRIEDQARRRNALELDPDRGIVARAALGGPAVQEPGERDPYREENRRADHEER